MANSFTTSVELYRPQFADPALSQAANLLALEPYGHGATRCSYQSFTYWDTAVANLQVLEALGIREAFVLGTSQGGWIAARMAMLAPDTVKGIIPLGTSWTTKASAVATSAAGTASASAPPLSTRSLRASKTTG